MMCAMKIRSSLVLGLLVCVAACGAVDASGPADAAVADASRLPDGAPLPDAIPPDQDTDGDGLLDAQETAGWDIQVTRPDGHGLVTVHVTSDPSHADTDGDGLSDHAEFVAHTDPSSADTDGDGLTDAEEPGLGTDPTNYDTDGNHVFDASEKKGLLVLYRMDALVGGKMIDTAGNGHDATATGNVAGFTQVVDRFGRPNHALYHAANGVNTAVNGWGVVDLGELIDPQHWSTSVWINSHAVTGQVIGQPRNFAFGSDGSSPTIEVASVDFGDGTGSPASFQYGADAWHHVVLVRDAADVSFYVDGAKVGSYSTTFSTGNLCTLLMIWAWEKSTCTGMPGGFNVMDASLDDVRVWKRALSAAEIKGLFEETQSN
jgi:hypothetical protein